jgi:hypothetical protein
MKSSVLWDIMPCSPFKVNRRFGGTCRHHQLRRISLVLAPAFALVSCLASTLKMKKTCSSETSVDFQRTTRCYIPEDGKLFITTGVRTSSPRKRNIFEVFTVVTVKVAGFWDVTPCILVISTLKVEAAQGSTVSEGTFSLQRALGRYVGSIQADCCASGHPRPEKCCDV